MLGDIDGDGSRRSPRLAGRRAKNHGAVADLRSSAFVENVPVKARFAARDRPDRLPAVPPRPVNLLTPETLIATGERDVGIACERVHHGGQEFRLPPIIVL